MRSTNDLDSPVRGWHPRRGITRRLTRMQKKNQQKLTDHAKAMAALNKKWLTGDRRGFVTPSPHTLVAQVLRCHHFVMIRNCFATCAVPVNFCSLTSQDCVGWPLGAISCEQTRNERETNQTSGTSWPETETLSRSNRGRQLC